MVNILRALCLIAALAITGSAHAAVRILATTADWGALASELGGDKVDVYTATNALQDVHRVDAKPSLVARARNADLVVANGAELEAGWLPVLLQESGNRKVQPGTPGYFEATAQLRLIEVPTAVDRAMGDIHPQGNPHVQLDPRNIACRREGAHREARCARCGECRLLRGPRLGFSEPLAGGDRALGGGGGAPQGRAGRGDAQGPVISLPLARAQAACRNRAQARRATQRRLPCGTRHDALVRAAADDSAQRLQRSESSELALGARACPGRDPAVFGRGHTGCQDLYGLFDDSIRQLLAVPR